MRSPILLAAFLAACLTAAAAQTPAAAPAIAKAHAAAPDFSQEPVVLREARLVMQFHADGTGARTEFQAFTLNSDASVRNFSVISLAYASATQTAEFVSVRVRHADGTTTDTPLDGVQEQPAQVTVQAPFYSDLRIKQLPVRGLRVGDTLEWQTRTNLVHPEAPNEFWGNLVLVRNLPTLSQTVELRLPTATKTNVWTNPANRLTPERTTEGSESVFRWKWQSLEPTVGKEAEAAKKAREGHLLTADEELDETEGRLPDLAFTTFPDWAAVGAWYRALEGDRMQPDAAVRAKAAEITAHSATEQDKVRAVYDWVSTNIRYIGVAFGIGRYQPHNAATVLENQYGDCKDKHTLLAAMLIAVGQQPDAALIGSGIRFNAAVPSPESFNHLITHLTLAGNSVWLDSTAEVAPFQVLMPQIRDKQALVVPPTGAATVQRTPADSPLPGSSSMTVHGKIAKDLSSDSDFVYSFQDDNGLGLRAVLHQVSPAQYPEFVQKLMGFLGFGGTTSDPVIDNVGDIEKPLVLRFHYHRDHNPDWGENRVTVAFGPTELPAFDADKPIVSTIRLGALRTARSVVDMELPDGWSAELPEAIHQALPQVRVDTTYRDGNHSFHAERTVQIVQSKIPVAQSKQYTSFYTASDAGSVPYVQLVPPQVTATSTGPLVSALGQTTVEASHTASPKTEAERLKEADRLVGLANEKLQNGNVDGAEQDLNAAKEYNPNAHELWGDLGAIASRRGNRTESMKLYRKEVELYPDSDFAWRDMVQTQMVDNYQAAAATAREWIAASPNTLEPRSTLLGLLWNTGDNAAALTAAKAAEAALPADVRDGNAFQLLLGEAQLRAGDTAAGAKALTHLLGNAPDPTQRNDAAYELAVARTELPMAESVERKLVAEREAQTLTWTGDESFSTLRGGTSLVAAAWDTLGWILYQEGKFTEAENYILPSWLISGHAVVGEHLGDVYTALHKDADAREAYDLAAGNVQHSTAAQFDSLRKKAAAAAEYQRQHGTVPASHRLASMRNVVLPDVSERVRTATYFILFTRDHTLRAKPFGDIFPPPADGALVHSAQFPAFFPKGESAALEGTFLLSCVDKECALRLKP